jgi:hypothetical protein
MLQSDFFRFSLALQMNRKDIAENSVSARNDQRGSAEFTPDGMGFFQETDVSPALGAMNKNLGLGFG